MNQKVGEVGNVAVTNYGDNPYKKTCEAHFQQSWGGSSSIKRTLTDYRTA